MARGKSNSNGWLMAAVVALAAIIIGGVGYFLYASQQQLITDDQGAGVDDDQEGGVLDVIEEVPIIGGFVSESADLVIDGINGAYDWLFGSG